MEHPGAGSIVVTNDQPDGLLEGDVDGVLPLERLDVSPLLVEHLEEEPVKMKWMGPLRLVDDGPDLRVAGPRGDWMTRGERRAVDAVFERAVGTLRERELDGHRRRASGDDWLDRAARGRHHGALVRRRVVHDERHQ